MQCVDACARENVRDGRTERERARERERERERERDLCSTVYGFIIIITDADAPLHAEMHKDLL